MRLGIYGGAFSPVHNSHVKIAKAFVESFALDKLLVIPTGRAPHKSAEGEIDSESRLNMCRLAFGEIDSASVSDMEVRREGMSYTSLTLKELTAPDTEIFMLIGSDKLENLGKWYEADKIFELCTVVYVSRLGENGNAEENVARYVSDFGAKIEKLNVTVEGISSNEIREAIREGRDIGGLVPKNVESYIKENRLYLNKNEQ